MKEWLVIFKDVDTSPFIEAYNEARTENTDITDRSTQGDNSKQYTLFTEDLKPLALLFHSYIKKVKGVGHRDLKIGNGWCVEGDKGSWHRLHNHTLIRNGVVTDDGLACVLYLDVPNGEDRGQFYYLIKDGENINLNFIMPDKGDLIFMPKTVFHGVYPQKAEGLRRTLNFDFTYAN
tara:strand:+ start:122 stop:652 length:531 start_codon:yes stop_codon:yes gene_type:complete